VATAEIEHEEILDDNTTKERSNMYWRVRIIIMMSNGNRDSVRREVSNKKVFVFWYSVCDFMRFKSNLRKSTRL